MNVKAHLKRTLTGVLVLLLALCVCACGASGPKEEEQVQAVVDNTMAVFKNPSQNDLSEFLDDETASALSSYGVDMNEFLTAAVKHMSYTVNEVTVEEDTAQVAMTVTNVNLDTAMADALAEFDAWTDTDEAVAVYKESGEQGLYQKLFELLYAKMDEMADATTSADVTLYLQKQEDGSWDVTSEGNEAFYSALYGGATFNF